MKRYLPTLFFLAFCNTAMAGFEDVTDQAGMARIGESFGASWGDFNGDGLPDLWVSNHADAPNLFLNNGDGTFTDIAMQVWPGRLLPLDTVCLTETQGVCLSDTHGAAWADFDNDGDEDLIEVVGGQRGNHFFVNDGTELQELSLEFGLRAMGSRSRTPGWLDWNGDGRLDSILTHDLNAQVHPLLLTNDGETFIDAEAETGIGQHAATSLHLVDLDEDLKPEIFLSRVNSNSGKAFSTATVPFTDLIPSLPVTQGSLACTDAVFADFDGDGRVDVFSTCGSSGQEVLQRNDQQIEMKLLTFQREDAVEFDASQAVTFSVYPSFLMEPEDHLRVGASAFLPPLIEHPELGWRSFSFTLDPLDPAIVGVPPHMPGVDLGLYVSFDDQTSRWRIALSTPVGTGLSVVVSSKGVLSNMEVLGFNGTPLSSFPKYARRVDGGFEDRRAASGFVEPFACGSAAGGDFDNDGDVDLFLVCSNPISNTPDRLYLNDGTGVFALSPDHEDVAGSDIGGGDSVAVADYDGDGFLDLFVNNGSGGAPFHFGPNHLFRNTGNSNHWLEIDLIGQVSNRDAIGATVTLETAAGTQMRLRDGGIHSKSQNHKRLHFGLADATVVSSLTVHWPSGLTSTLSNIAVDQILTITEPSDGDGDGIQDVVDNCIGVENTDQLDTDADGHGNLCDADFNNDCNVNVADLGQFRANFLTTMPLYDLNGDGQVNFIDLGRLRLLFFEPVGPSAAGALCSNSENLAER